MLVGGESTGLDSESFNPHPPGVGGCSELQQEYGAEVMLFQSSPARGGRVLTIACKVSRTAVCFNPHPPEVGGCSRSRWRLKSCHQFQSSPARGGRVLVLLAIHGLDCHQFQSSPARGGRVHKIDPAFFEFLIVSILTRPRWAGALCFRF